MSPRTGLLFVALVVAAPHVALAQAADARTIEEVKAADSGVWNAANACDKDAWSALVADDVALITPYGFVLDKARLLQSTTVQCTINWEMEQLKVQLYDKGNTAVVIGHHKYKSKPGKNGHDGRYIYTRIYEKRNSKWLWVFGQHQIITDDTKVGGHYDKEPMTAKDIAILSGFK